MTQTTVKKYYRYEDQDGSHVISDFEIINTYYPYWSSLMVKAGRRPDWESCVEDWVVVHYAWPIPIEEAELLMKGPV